MGIFMKDPKHAGQGLTKLFARHLGHKRMATLELKD